MWKAGSKWKLEKEDYKEIQNRIQQGEHLLYSCQIDCILAFQP